MCPCQPKGWLVYGGPMSVDEQRLQRRQAERLVAQRRYAEAAEVYRSLLARDDTHAKAWYGIGYCYYKMGHLDQSRLSMREARRRGYLPADAMLDRIRSRIGRNEPLPPSTPAPLVAATPAPLPPAGRRAGARQIPATPATADHVVVLTQALRRLSEHRKSLRQELDALLLDTGTKAVAEDALADWPQVVAVREAHNAEELSETERIKADKRERAAREKYHTERLSHQETVERLRAAYDAIDSELKSLRERTKAVEQEISAAKAGIKAALHAGTGISTRGDTPMVRFREAKEGAEKSRAKLAARLDEIKTAAHVEADKLRTEEANWRIDRERLIRDIDNAQAATEQAAARARQAHEAHQARLLELGRTIAGAGKNLPFLSESIAQADRLQRAIASNEADIAEKQQILQREGPTAGH